MPDRYWFPAKQHGWGWGPPVAWQGWLVLIAFICLVVAAAWMFPPRTSLAAYLGCVFALAAAVVAICWLKGEPPHWRWGDPGRATARRDQ